MKKTALIISIILTALLFAACGRKALTPEDISGTWENVIEGPVVTSTYVYTFKTDFTYTVSSVSGSDVVSLSYDDSDKYALSGSTITIYDGNEANKFEVKFKDGNMIWITEAGKERVFTRK